VIDWRKGRTGNTLLKTSIFEPGVQHFRPECLSGEDQDFFSRMIAKGHVFVWCHEALVHEVVPKIRWKRTFMLKRALLRGAITLVQPTFGAADMLKSIVAVPVYTAALPFTLLLGHHRFMSCLIKLCDHAGAVLAMLGIRAIKQPYVTE